MIRLATAGRNHQLHPQEWLRAKQALLGSCRPLSRGSAHSVQRRKRHCKGSAGRTGDANKGHLEGGVDCATEYSNAITKCADSLGLTRGLALAKLGPGSRHAVLSQVATSAPVTAILIVAFKLCELSDPVAIAIAGPW